MFVSRLRGRRGRQRWWRWCAWLALTTVPSTSIHNLLLQVDDFRELPTTTTNVMSQDIGNP